MCRLVQIKKYQSNSFFWWQGDFLGKIKNFWGKIKKSVFLYVVFSGITPVTVM